MIKKASKGIELIAALSVAFAAPALATDYFSQSYYSPTTGRVGYHMVVSLHYPLSNAPEGCQPLLNGFETQGTVPPGLTAPVFVPYGQNVGNFEGTPRQPGDWDMTVTLKDVQCSNSGQHFGDRAVSIHFHIDP